MATKESAYKIKLDISNEKAPAILNLSSVKS